MRVPFGSFLSDFLHLLYPPYCVACAGPLVKGEDWICTSCLMQLPRPGYHLYRENPVFLRLVGRLPLDFAAAFLLFTRGGRVQHILHALKYHNVPALAVYLGKIYGGDLKEAGLGSKADMIVPVPLHPARQRKRGYNQSAEFARGLSAAINVPLNNSILVRERATETQTRKNRLMRWQNVENAFALKQAEAVKGRRILLVDDVITTGATLEACGQILVKAGAVSLSVAGIAYAG